MNIDSNRFTEKSREAQNIARKRNHQETDGWHLLSALLGEEHGTIPSLLGKMEITPSAVALVLERELDRLPAISGSIDLSWDYVTQTFQEALTGAEAKAGQLKDEYVSVEHLFLGILGIDRDGELQRFSTASASMKRRF